MLTITPSEEKKRLLKEALITRDGPHCLYCRKVLAITQATLDHIITVSKGGTYSLTNLVLACKKCNNARGSTEFFQWIKPYHFKEELLRKLRKLQFTYRYIRVLNAAKENGIDQEYAVAQKLIHQAYLRLKFNPQEHRHYQYTNLLPDDVRIDFSKPEKRNRIIQAFIELTKSLDEWGWALGREALKKYRPSIIGLA